jgi:hypothetical protein
MIREWAALADVEAGTIVTESGWVQTAFPLPKSRRFIVTFNC